MHVMRNGLQIDPGRATHDLILFRSRKLSSQQPHPRFPFDEWHDLWANGVQHHARRIAAVFSAN